MSLGLDELFPEPEQPPQPVQRSGETVTVGSHALDLVIAPRHPLWGHLIYPAAKLLAEYLAANPALVKAQPVLELGAGVGLPGIAAALLGASHVVLSDYPDHDLVDTLRKNVNSLPEDVRARLSVEGYIWGKPVDVLIRHISTSDTTTTTTNNNNNKFKLIILSDLNFNHSQHIPLLKSCRDSCADDGVVLCFFAHHRPLPHFIEADKALITLAHEQGWAVTRILEHKNAGVAFPEDNNLYSTPEQREHRSTVHGFKLTRPPRETQTPPPS